MKKEQEIWIALAGAGCVGALFAMIAATASMPKDPISLSQLLGQFGTLQKTFRQQLEVFHHLREKHIIRRSSREANCIYDPFLPLIAVEKPYNALMTANDALSEYLI